MDQQPDLKQASERMQKQQEEVGRRLQEARKRWAGSQALLAVNMQAKGHKWTQDIVTRTERGVRPLGLLEAQSLCSALGLSVGSLVGEEQADRARVAAEHELTLVQDYVGQRLAALQRGV